MKGFTGAVVRLLINAAQEISILFLQSLQFLHGGRHYQDHEALIDDLRASLSGDVKLLVKGSRGMRMERVVEALVEG